VKDLGFVGLALVVATCGARLAPSAKPAPAARPVPADACHAAFREATVRALRDWQFLPARREVRHESADVDGNGKPDYTWLVPEPVTIFVDLEFTFRIVEGRGVVAPKGGDADAP
jgi:hypothetical protein